MKRISSRKAELRRDSTGISRRNDCDFPPGRVHIRGALSSRRSGQKRRQGKAAESPQRHRRACPSRSLTEDEAILQALNRLGFGPRPGDLERVKEMGLQKWIDQQLHPESIDDSALDARLRTVSHTENVFRKTAGRIPASRKSPRAAKASPSRNTGKSSRSRCGRPCRRPCRREPCRASRIRRRRLRATRRATCRWPTRCTCRISTPWTTI